MFSTVSIACETLPSLMLSLSCHVSPTVLSALDDSDPAVCQHVWNAVLSVLKNITVSYITRYPTKQQFALVWILCLGWRYVELLQVRVDFYKYVPHHDTVSMSSMRNFCYMLSSTHIEFKRDVTC